MSEVQIFNWYLVFYLQAIPALVKLERGNLIKSQDNQLKLGYWCNFKACLLTENKWIKFCLVTRSRLASLDVVLSSCETRGFHSRSKCQKDLGDVCVGGRGRVCFSSQKRSYALRVYLLWPAYPMMAPQDYRLCDVIAAPTPTQC